MEKKTIPKLQEPRTVKKIAMLDEHICCAYAGLTADARVLINKARVECQSHRLQIEDPVTVEYIARFIAGVQQVRTSLKRRLFLISWKKYTQKGGVRPFGLCTLVVGFNAPAMTPTIYLTEPSGVHSEWKANAIGRGGKTVREFLEKSFVEGLSDAEAVKLTVRGLLEVVQTGAANIEIAVMDPSNAVKQLSTEEIQKIIDEVEKEKQEEAEKKRTAPK